MSIPDSVKIQMGSWLSVMAPFLESEEFSKITSYLKERVSAGKIVIPRSSELFKPFSLCNRDKLKAVIVLMEPYNMYKKIGDNDVPVASGIPLSCADSGVPQPAVEMWYDALTDCYGWNPDTEVLLDLGYLLKEEHVLLVNSSLTVEKDAVGSHISIWAPFMQHLFQMLNQYHSGLPIVLIGTQAQKYTPYIDQYTHYILKVEHPMAAVMQKRQWNHQQFFREVNDIIRRSNGESECIMWRRNKVWQDSKKSTYKWDESKLDNSKIDDLPF